MNADDNMLAKDSSLLCSCIRSDCNFFVNHEKLAREYRLRLRFYDRHISKGVEVLYHSELPISKVWNDLTMYYLKLAEQVYLKLNLLETTVRII